MKTYKYNTKKGEIKVKFYPTGCYTLTFNNVEHEIGQWSKTQWGNKNQVEFNITKFGGETNTYMEQKSAAYWIMMAEYHSL